MTPLTAVVAPSAADLYPCDQFRFADLLTDAERTVLARLRAVLDTKVRPLLDEYWEKGEFPSQVMPELIGLNLMEPAGALYAGLPQLRARPHRLLGGDDVQRAVRAVPGDRDRHGGSPAQAARWTRRSARSRSPGCSR